MTLKAILKRFLERVLLKEIVEAMAVTFKHVFTRADTVQYPRKKRRLPDTNRGALVLLHYEDGTERCVGCTLCEIACPSYCIRVVSDQEEGKPLTRFAKEFYIDMSRCVFCGFCVEACPVNALSMIKMYEYASADKRDLIFDKQKLHALGDLHYQDAKAYLVAHRQEAVDEESRQYRYRHPAPLVK